METTFLSEYCVYKHYGFLFCSCLALDVYIINNLPSAKINTLILDI